ncbi:MAG: 2-keto-4-pentenoate hydratase [Synergistaceae bacterium]|jgi:2-keto-4-pentenoate hydratase|nr:2-keto-4-pentenoate hydratase [Synergistaceae bacterium]
MGDEKKRIKFAAALYEAERSRKVIPPLSRQDASLTVEDAYAIQLENVRRLVGEGQVVTGKKIGLTSPGIQAQLNVHEPDYGHLFASMDCSSGDVPTDKLIQPKIEAELAFILNADLSGGSVTVEDVRKATECVVGSFEIVDSRVEDWKIKLVDTVADNASSCRYVLGKKRIPLGDMDLAAVTMKLWKNGAVIAEGAGSAVMGDPCLSVAWLSNRLWDFGVPLKKGEVILSGAFTAAPFAQKGDVFRVEFSTFGEVEARFL